MKKRIISAIVALIIVVPLIVLGDYFFALGVFVVAMLAYKELIDLKKSHGEYPKLMIFLGLFCLLSLVLSNYLNFSVYRGITYQVITMMLLLLLLPVIFYQNDKYTSKDAFYLIGGIFFLGTSFHSFMLLRNAGLEATIYLLLIAICTDTYAYLTGSLVGKHKLLEEISPKKTWEGMLGGTIFGTLIASYYFYLVINPNMNVFTIISISLFLSILGQFGDLVFSSIKRYFKAKDFSNLIPGHGGVLDRCDSLIFIALGFMFFITII